MASEPPRQGHAHEAYVEETILLENDLVELERLGELVASIGRRCAWSLLFTKDLELALDEIVTNIISYAYDDDRSHLIVVRLIAASGAVTVEVEDDGTPFDPTSAPAAPVAGAIDERPVGGLGWHFVRSVVDELVYRRAGNRNVVKVSKQIPKSMDPADERQP